MSAFLRRGAVAWKHTRTMETVSCRVATDDGAWDTVRGWKGKTVELVRDKPKKNEGSHERTEDKDLPSWIQAYPELEGQQHHPMVRQLCEMDAQAKSWRKKLEALKGAVEGTTRSAVADPRQAQEEDEEDVSAKLEGRWTHASSHLFDGQPPETYPKGAEGDLEATACANLYLSWMARGLVPCLDADGHHRPNHHARISKELFEMVDAIEARARSRVRAMAPRTGRELHPSHDVGLEGTLARRVSARLPAFDARFTHAEPLTRIRDIAHGKGADGRCEEVRKEIKHTIQNKLHRACGPEDLVASAKMLAKLTAEGADYPQAFVDEFRIFFRELKDFFGVSGLRDVLDALCPHLEVEGIRQVESLRRALDGWQEWEDAQTALEASQGEGRLVEPTDPADPGQGHPVDGRGFAHALQVARLASDLRGTLLDALSGQERPTTKDGKDREESTCTARYTMRMADARLEELAFVKLSTACTFLESARRWLAERRDPSQRQGENESASLFQESGWKDLLCLEIQALIVGMDHAAFLPHLEIPGRSITEECGLMLKRVPGWSLDDSWEALVERTVHLFGAPTSRRSPDQPIPPSPVPTMLQAKSLFQKARSLSSRHAEQLEKVLVPRAVLFARGLRNADSAGLLEESTKVHEAEVRSDAGFAVARLADAGLASLRVLRRVAAGSEKGNEVWDAVVVGTAFGQLDVAETPEDAWKVNGHSPPRQESAWKYPSRLDHGRCGDPGRTNSRSNGHGNMSGKILLLHSATGDEDIGAEVKGILLRHPIPHLSHLALRARQQRVPMAAADDPCSWDALASLPSGLQVELSVTEEGMVSILEKEGAERTEASPDPPIRLEKVGNADVESFLRSSKVVESSVQAGLRIHLMEQETDPVDVTRLAGAKAGHCFALQELSTRLEKMDQGTPFRVPKSAFLPRGSMELHLQEIGLMDTYQELLENLEDASAHVMVEKGPMDRAEDLRMASALVRDFLSNNAVVPDSALHPLVQAFGGGAVLMVRSSATDEDLPGASAAGLYDSVPALVEGVYGVSSPGTGPWNRGLASSIARVWSSLYSDRAVNNRLRTSGIHQGAQMGVLVQELVHPKICFVMMTKDPFRKDPSSAYIELARGHGEVLASASIPGVPVRLRLSKTPGQIEYSLLSLESYNVQLMVGRDGHLWEEWSQDNSRQGGDWSAMLRDAVPKLQALCLSIEKEFKEPQDIEGCITNEGQVVVFQTRVQP